MLVWMVYALAHHREVQEKIYKEIINHVGEQDVSFDQLHKFKYIDNVIDETLRIFPSFPFYDRRCLKDDVFNGYKIEAGTDIIMSLYNLHRLGGGPEVNTFNPDRQNDSSLFNGVPFGVGRHLCVGRKLALLTGKVILIQICRNFIVKPLGGTTFSDSIEIKVASTMEPKSGLYLNFERR